MKLVFIVFLIFASVYGERVEDEHSWILIPTEEGDLHLAYLHDIESPNNKDPEEKAEWDPFIEITFHLYTRSNPVDPVQVFVGNLNNSAYDPSKRTMFILHGYNSNFFTGGNLAMKDAFLRAEDCNVVGVDWSGPGGGVLYNVCRNNAKPTGEYVGLFYLFLESVGATLQSMYCAGHSLGAHVCGYSGKAVNGSLGRISGLDPALPLFNLDVPEERLAITDAVFVDIIHTCGGYLGFEAPIGHADFYPNNGTRNQPGCGLDVSGSCSHGRAHEFFVESIESLDFVAHLCPSYDEYQNGSCFTNEVQLMGFPSSTSSSGSYHLSTAAESPFALG